MFVTVDFFPDGVLIGEMFDAYILDRFRASRTSLGMLAFTEACSMPQSSSESIFSLFLSRIFRAKEINYI
jgi:hypothetical protein